MNRIRWTLVAMCFAQFMTQLDSTIVNVALPSIQRDLHTVPESLQWTVDAYVLTSAVLILLGGKLGDRFGRKRMFLVGMTIFTLASAACALATSDEQLVAFRAVQGTGGALLTPLSLSILTAAFPRKQLPTAIGIWAGISGIGLSAGPLIGGALVEHVSWSAVFWINVPIGAIGGAICLWAVAESRDAQRRQLDVVGTGLITAGLFALVVAVIGTNSHAWTSVRTLGLLAAAAVLAAVFLAWERHQVDPMVPLRFFRRPAFSTASTVALLVGFSYIGVLYLIVLYLQNVLDYSPLEAGMRTLPLPLTQMLVAANAGRIDRLLGARIKMSLGMLLISGGLFGLAQIHVGSSHGRILPFLSLLGCGMGLAIPAVNAAGMAAVDGDESGVGAGVVTTARHVGGALGIAVLGAIAAATARGDWHQQLSQLTPAAQAKAADLTALVLDGQGERIGALAGKAAQEAAFDSFVHGVNYALLAGSAIAFIGAALAYIGLRPQVAGRSGQRVRTGGGQRGAQTDAGRADAAAARLTSTLESKALPK